MSHHLVLGAGTIGSVLAIQLANDGHEVRVVTRSGTGPSHPGIALVKADVLDRDALRPHAAGAAAVYNTLSPPSYQQWSSMWPPLAAAVLDVAESSGAVLVTISNLYGYGPVVGPISRDLPLAATEHKGRLRARLWQDALAAHQAGRVRVTEARASDFLGPGVGLHAGLITRYGQAAMAGKPVRVLGDPDAPHSFTYVDDVARTLAVLGTDERAWGHPWHVPSSPPVSVRNLLESATQRGGIQAPRIRRIPRSALTLLSPFSPTLREVRGVLYQWEAPFEIDATATTTVFGLEHTPWDDVMRRTTADWQQ
ncbi:NAD-dependent epimerase/dehydratase family protein [Phytoactinopolyspora halotolerans]|uniref:NAD-dependent epimerase/dehydratase family protein n=1 Tax=Phytoactinopolyspora halotolerans TaxID=1981512 RepID=A0A6L9SEH7_9ACTN|nr:NAD-dependent epimerase/dehydratase family protein [Phytoactinopolyspora halotolerans]NEE02988.1 NAD-dependent epimerase/dehydratase family protein [Phytoactinopolyspora halotolerans]